MSGSVEVVLVDSCLRDGAGGSPTAVVTDHHRLTDADLTRIPRLVGASHVAVVSGPTRPDDSRLVRFFTPTGELPGCGHGTVAVIAVLTAESGQHTWHGVLRAGSRTFAASGVRDPRNRTVEAWFEQGHVECHRADPQTVQPFLAALGLDVTDLHPADEPTVASPGKPRLLIPVVNRRILGGLEPDFARLAAESRRYGQLGCYVYSPPTTQLRAAARMFAPIIGVDEDVANANSTGCQAAHRLISGDTAARSTSRWYAILAVDQGDVLSRPSTVYATATRTPAGVATRVGGTARLADTVRVIVP